MLVCKQVCRCRCCGIVMILGDIDCSQKLSVDVQPVVVDQVEWLVVLHPVVVDRLL